MKTIIEEDKVRQQVRERYGAIARLEERGCGCGSSCGDSTEAKLSSTAAEALGYSDSDVASVPEGSEMGLGCGNPTAFASIKPGETVLDLGSGGGFDCSLLPSRRRVYTEIFRALKPGGRIAVSDNNAPQPPASPTNPAA